MPEGRLKAREGKANRQWFSFPLRVFMMQNSLYDSV
jgi:hypothetical protein